METLKNSPVPEEKEKDPIIEKTVLLEKALREARVCEENAAEIALMTCCFLNGNLEIDRRGGRVVLVTKEITGGELGISFTSESTEARFWRDRVGKENFVFYSPVETAEILFRSAERFGMLLLRLENGNSLRIEPDPDANSNIIKYFSNPNLHKWLGKFKGVD